MNAKYRTLLVFIILTAPIMLLTLSTEGAQPTVNLKFVMSPDTRTIRLGEIPEIILTTRAEGHDLKFHWEHEGPGKFKGERDKPTIIYIPPDSIDGENAEITITVTVTDEKGQEAQDSITFMLLTPKATAIPILPTPTPLPIHIRKVFLKEKDGIFIPPTYLVKPGGFVIITVDMKNPSNRKVRVEHEAVFGTVEWHQQELIYIAPKEPGSGDIVTVKVVDQETNEIIDKEVFNIKISDKP